MTTKNEHVARIAGLLHQTRSASWTSDRSLELSAAMKTATPGEMALALLEFSHDLLRAAKSVTELQLNAAIGEQVMNERDATGGRLQ